MNPTVIIIIVIVLILLGVGGYFAYKYKYSGCSTKDGSSSNVLTYTSVGGSCVANTCVSGYGDINGLAIDGTCNPTPKGLPTGGLLGNGYGGNTTAALSGPKGALIQSGEPTPVKISDPIFSTLVNRAYVIAKKTNNATYFSVGIDGGYRIYTSTISLEEATKDVAQTFKL